MVNVLRLFEEAGCLHAAYHVLGLCTVAKDGPVCDQEFFRDVSFIIVYFGVFMLEICSVEYGCDPQSDLAAHLCSRLVAVAAPAPRVVCC